MRNVINEHTRELYGQRKKKVKRVREKESEETKDVQWKEGGGARGSTRAKIYYDARGREITGEERRGKRESRWTGGGKGKGEPDSVGASAREGWKERAAGVSR